MTRYLSVCQFTQKVFKTLTFYSFWVRTTIVFWISEQFLCNRYTIQKKLVWLTKYHIVLILNKLYLIKFYKSSLLLSLKTFWQILAFQLEIPQPYRYQTALLSSQSNYDSQSSGTKGFGKKFLARICCMFGESLQEAAMITKCNSDFSVLKV